MPKYRLFLLLLCLPLVVQLAACRGSQEQGGVNGAASEFAVRSDAVLSLPQLTPVPETQERPLRVVATTSIIGDVVRQVGGEVINLTTLMGPGQDPHSYEPSTTELTNVAQADVVFINGWDLEEGLVDDLANIAAEAPLVPVSANITPLAFGGHTEDEETRAEGAGEEAGSVDPHVWLDPQGVRQWTQNIQEVLSALDPQNASLYAANAQAYLDELAALEAYMEERLALIPAADRKLVTNHDALAYFARRFDFELVGTVIPAASTVAEPSAQDLVSLVQRMRTEGVCTIFAESTASARLAETVAAELEGCPTVQVLSLYTGALGPEGSGASSYLDMMRRDTDTVVSGLGD